MKTRLTNRAFKFMRGFNTHDVHTMSDISYLNGMKNFTATRRLSNRTQKRPVQGCFLNL